MRNSHFLLSFQLGQAIRCDWDTNRIKTLSKIIIKWTSKLNHITLSARFVLRRFI